MPFQLDNQEPAPDYGTDDAVNALVLILVDHPAGHRALPGEDVTTHTSE